ncbi:hypothetical protein ACUZ8Y_22745 [Aeromonas veronii]|uniref:hypothetical protein n=1 Tax=Aeromonas veronii TaxID=654 RepID=UPI00406BC6B5
MSSAPRGVTAGADDPARGVPAGPVPTAGPPAADRLGAQGGHCRCQQLATCSMSEGDTAGGGDPARGSPAGPVPAAGARAADELGALGGHCWSR